MCALMTILRMVVSGFALAIVDQDTGKPRCSQTTRHLPMADFLRRGAAGDFRRSSSLKTGAILVHNVDIRLGRERLGDELHNRVAVLRHTRHHQMSDDEAALGDPMRIKPQVTDLAVHLLDDRAHHLRVVACPVG